MDPIRVSSSVPIIEHEALLIELPIPQNLNQKSDWSGLPQGLLEKIMKNQGNNIADRHRFRAICSLWRSGTQNPTSSRLPFLMLSYHQVRATHRSFYYLLEDKVFWLDLLMNREQGWICGASRGWLLMIDQTVRVSLLNLITKAQICVPPLTDLCLWPNDMGRNQMLLQLQELGIIKCVLSSPPDSNSDCVIMVIYANGGGIAFYRPDDRHWTVVKDSIPPSERLWYDDIEYFEGRFHVVDGEGRIVVIDLHSSSATQIKPASIIGQNYLVESSGGLLLVSRQKGHDVANNVFRTLSFKVFERDPITDNWVERTSLGDCSLFLGRNHSLAIVASEFPEIKGNCIYFTVNSFAGFPHDVGIFNLEDNKIKLLLGYNYASEFTLDPPMWVTTSSV